ncbi:MAG TPA: ribonuclease P protein component [Candidatus Deferrimicrobium sp.]|nr:ribonuclease P protein component [Candidatus Deferrimicrobium sp.]
MISRHRLRGRRRFAAVRAGGIRAASAGVRAQLATNDLGVARVGFALVDIRSAVRRNLLRRRLRAILRPMLGPLAGRDLVIVAGADALELPFGDLRAAVEAAVARVLERAGSAAVGSTADNGAVTRSAQVDR